MAYLKNTKELTLHSHLLSCNKSYIFSVFIEGRLTRRVALRKTIKTRRRASDGYCNFEVLSYSEGEERTRVFHPVCSATVEKLKINQYRETTHLWASSDLQFPGRGKLPCVGSVYFSRNAIPIFSLSVG